MPVEALISALKSIPSDPGVYRMVNAQGQDLYIGKAKNLYKRVSSYTHLSRLPHRLKRMVHHLVDVRILVTKTELDALLLEANLIGRYKPPYNILLKQGHSFSYLVLSDHPFPRIFRQRAPTLKGYCFGPFLSTAPLEEIMVCLYKAFLLRSCSDTVFSQRTRPCLQYHIKRCSAPCVGKINQEEYKTMVEQAVRFLKGQTSALRQDMVKEMEAFSRRHAYDQARVVRDRIEALTHMASSRETTARMIYSDVLAFAHRHGISCVQLVSFRHGLVCGAEAFFFPDTTPQDGPDILAALIKSLYAQSAPPERLLFNLPLEDEEEASLKLLFRHHFQQVPHFVYPKRGAQFRMVEEAERHADHSLKRHLESHQVQKDLWEQAQGVLGLPFIPQRIEVYDNSHHQGDCPVGIMVVASPEGWMKKEYRTFAMHSQDDYEMMRAVMKKRFRMDLPLPDLMIIDGGKGQLSAVQSTLCELGIKEPYLISIAKSDPYDVIHLAPRFEGAEGRPGGPVDLPAHHPVLHLIQRLRDEAHRFAVHTHRRRKGRRMTTSLLQQLPGIGPKRYQQLMEHFVTLEAIKAASLKDLEKIFPPGVARKISEGLSSLKEEAS